MPRINKRLDTDVCQFEFELDEREYAAIGRAMVQWAYLEQSVYKMSVAIAEFVGVELSAEARSVSFSRRVRVLRDLVSAHATDAEKARMLRLLDRVANVEQDRHQVAHGTWEWEPENPEVLRVSCLRPGKTFEKQYDFERIVEVGDRIGQLSFEIEYPGGWEQAFTDTISGGDAEADHVSFFSASRDFVRAITKSKSATGTG